MKIDAEILIEAPPRVVREVWLDFPHLSDWHDGSFWKNIELTAPEKSNGLDAVPGDEVKCTMPSMTFKCNVAVNQPDHFRWANSVPLMGSAGHDYYFMSVPGEANRTRFVQHEDITGAMGLIMGMMGTKESSNKGWKKINEDLKAASEKRWAAESGH
ncbi:hypothetical protein BD324DRAFT_620867 [Kockovaella imperatae]|uniref:SRPBCC domain-containing protein n=1 Tax=Kockovaella imperatae TaxID=4999 RepID=A0A1Y1ULS9_9TREE|nr:hypothetical protein BD324DRAFT_620867 [Kockovaella imperatae]ORX38436.1 hypothetical protein BD324DRAFT_620867 [Kockovaella imperatae]